MAQDRSTMEKLTAEPMIVIFGGETFEVKPLSIRQCRKFTHAVRGLASKAMNLAEQAFAEDGSATVPLRDLPMRDQLSTLFDWVLPLFDTDLVMLGKLVIPSLNDRSDEWIEDNVTVGELQLVLEHALKVNFPLPLRLLDRAGGLGGMRARP